MRKKVKVNASIEVCKCDSWEKFISEVRRVRMVGNRIFRGQRKPDWPLSSMWERWLLQMKGKDTDRKARELFSPGAYGKIRDSYLQRFKHLASEYSDAASRKLSERDWWALGRHYGLFTPLLDWTESPYIAAFFAFTDYIEGLNKGFKSGITFFERRTDKGRGSGITFGKEPVAVWELVRADELEKENEFEIFTSYAGKTERVRAQKSVFTFLSHNTHDDIESYLKSRGLEKYLRKYEIPGQEMGKVVGDLKLMNITFASLYPDFEGAAIQANLWDTLEKLGQTGSFSFRK